MLLILSTVHCQVNVTLQWPPSLLGAKYSEVVYQCCFWRYSEIAHFTQGKLHNPISHINSKQSSVAPLPEDIVGFKLLVGCSNALTKQYQQPCRD